MITGPNPCYVCNKDVKKPRYYVEVYNGGRDIRKVGEADPNVNDPGYCGCYPVGSDCAKKLRRDGVRVFDERG